MFLFSDLVQICHLPFSTSNIYFYFIQIYISAYVYRVLCIYIFVFIYILYIFRLCSMQYVQIFSIKTGIKLSKVMTKKKVVTLSVIVE